MAVDKIASTLVDEEARLRDELRMISVRLDDLRTDLHRLERLKQVLQQPSGHQPDLKAVPVPKGDTGFDKLAEPRRRKSPSIKNMVMDVIHDSDRPLHAVEILQRINSKNELNIPRTSLSPQLSRLRQEGKLTYDPNTRLWGSRFHGHNIFG